MQRQAAEHLALVGITKADVAQAQGHRSAPLGAGGAAVMQRNGIAHHLVEAARRGQRGRQVLEGGDQGGDGIEGGQRDEDHQGDQRIRGQAAHAIGTEPEHQQHQQPQAEDQQARAEGTEPIHLPLRHHQVALAFEDPRAMSGLSPEQQQLGLILQIVDIADAQRAATGRQGAAGAAAEPIEQGRKAEANHQQSQRQDLGQLAIKQQQEGEQPHQRQQGADQRRDEAQVDVIHGIDIGHQAIEEIPLAETLQAGGGQGREPLPEQDAQPGEQAEGGIVSDHAIGPAAGGANDGQKADGAGRQQVVETLAPEPGEPGDGGSGQEPAREREQPDAGPQGEQAQQQADAKQAPVLTVQSQKR